MGILPMSQFPVHIFLLVCCAYVIYLRSLPMHNQQCPQTHPPERAVLMEEVVNPRTRRLEGKSIRCSLVVLLLRGRYNGTVHLIHSATSDRASKHCSQHITAQSSGRQRRSNIDTPLTPLLTCYISVKSLDSQRPGRAYPAPPSPRRPSQLIPSSDTDQDGPTLSPSPKPTSQLIYLPDSDQDGPTLLPSPYPPSKFTLSINLTLFCQEFALLTLLTLYLCFTQFACRSLSPYLPHPPSRLSFSTTSIPYATLAPSKSGGEECEDIEKIAIDFTAKTVFIIVSIAIHFFSRHISFFTANTAFIIVFIALLFFRTVITSFFVSIDLRHEQNNENVPLVTTTQDSSFLCKTRTKLSEAATHFQERGQYQHFLRRQKPTGNFSTGRVHVVCSKLCPYHRLYSGCGGSIHQTHVVSIAYAVDAVDEALCALCTRKLTNEVAGREIESVWRSQVAEGKDAAAGVAVGVDHLHAAARLHPAAGRLLPRNEPHGVCAADATRALRREAGRDRRSGRPQPQAAAADGGQVAARRHLRLKLQRARAERLGFAALQLHRLPHTGTYIPRSTQASVHMYTGCSETHPKYYGTVDSMSKFTYEKLADMHWVYDAAGCSGLRVPGVHACSRSWLTVTDYPTRSSPSRLDSARVTPYQATQIIPPCSTSLPLATSSRGQPATEILELHSVHTSSPLLPCCTRITTVQPVAYATIMAITCALRGRGDEVVRLLTSHLGELGTIPGGVARKFWHGEIVPTMPLVSEFSRGSLASPITPFRGCSILTSIHPHQIKIT
ncbi:hypothetical protein PR048_017324 [Dryococelus australis]|uniref:Uncharacterized protein n=1 Tax=Dryococelus australis TaxID=614101 RepID=A0ABQ9H990_9NEOP|nr:hypothetical protein PR048_017324 [Dryococelus australis]